MANAQLGEVVRYVRTLAAGQHSKDQTDGELLRAFSAQNDQAAFAALVKRHGPLVLGVCRRVLHHLQDAEDAFQATFLLLACKAHSIRKNESLASWLHGAAYRMSRNASRAALRRRKHEGRASLLPSPSPGEDVAWREVQAILDEEIGRLPEIYRQAFILCCLENKSRTDAARQLAVKEPTVRSRLAQARKLLQQRLGRRGVALSALLGALALSENTAPAMVSGSLISSTVKAALAFGAGNAPAAGVVSAQVTALVKGGLKTMFATKAKIVSVMLLALVLGASGVLTYRSLADPKAGAPPALDAKAHERREPGPNGLPPAAEAETKNSVKVSGRVLSPEGASVEGATIYLAYGNQRKYNKTSNTKPRVTSGADGHFHFSFSKAEVGGGWPAAGIVAVASGYGPQWVPAGSLREGKSPCGSSRTTSLSRGGWSIWRAGRSLERKCRCSALSLCRTRT